MSREYTNDRFNQDVRMLEYFQNEFQYRHQHFWNVLVKLFLLDVTIVMLPFISGIFGMSLKDMLIPYMLAFPIFGLIVAFFTRYLLKSEAKRISAVNNAKYRISESMPDEYQYEKFVDNIMDEREHIIFSLANRVFICELLLSIVAIIVLVLPDIPNTI